MKIIGAALSVLIVTGAALCIFVPPEGVAVAVPFDEAVIGADPDAYLATSEARFPDITPDTQKRIIWAGAKGAKTPIALIYLHGFSATSQEIRPVPDRVAAALGANLFYTRLAGHGRGSQPLAEATAGDWINDLHEAVAIGARIGARVVILSTSTGGTLAAIAATDPTMSAKLAGIVFVSPNFGLKPLAGKLLDLPFARIWGPWLVGATVGAPSDNPVVARFWTTSYPTVALFPMAALIRLAQAQDYGHATTPALFIFSEADQIVSPAKTKAVIATWTGPHAVEVITPGPGDDPYSHVIAGDALSPGHTGPVTERIVDWVRGL